MHLIIMTPLWFWEEPSYWADSLSPDTHHWTIGLAFSPLYYYEWRMNMNELDIP